jgi:hypothetical protein
MRAGARIFVFSLTISAAIAQGPVDPTSNNLANPNDNPITGEELVKWAVLSTVGPTSIIGGSISAGWGTLFNETHQYGTHWDGFGKRYGMRLTGIATSNVMEAGLGALTGEDPRYHRAADGSFGGRFGHVVKMTFLTQNRDGEIVPSYARYAGIAGSSFLSNSWRPDGEANTGHAVTRIGLGFLGRMSGNAFEEFWPDLRNRLFHHGR